MIEDVAPRGEGTPLHVHMEDDESFYVLDGELTYYLDGNEPIQGTAGTFVHIPGGAVHAFKVNSETARYLIITTPRHERFYRAMSEPATAPGLPPATRPNMDQVEAACHAYGVDVLGPPPGIQG